MWPLTRSKKLGQAVCILQRSIHQSLGPLSGHYTIMDATSSAALPHGVFATRVPKWMFSPDFDDATRLLLRPDILIIEGLPRETYLALRQDIESQSVAGTAFISSLKQNPTTKVHIIELGYTSDATYDHALSRKLTQHNRLASHLLSAGWSLASSPNPPALPDAHADDPPTPDPLPPQLPHNIPDFSHHVHIFLLSTSGVIYRPADTLCSILGIPPSEITDVLRSLHCLTIRFLDTIIKTRRRLEHDPTTFTLLTHFPVPPDPP